jgi:hypothetical protein
LLKWKKVKATGTKKQDLIKAYRAAPKPPIQVIWKCSEQAVLDALKDPSQISLQSTALGVAMKKMIKTLQNLLGDLDQEPLKELQVMLLAKQEREIPNAL